MEVDRTKGNEASTSAAPDTSAIGVGDAAGEVELIGGDPFQGIDRPATDRPDGRRPLVGTSGAAFIALALIVVAITVMSRPGPSAVSEQTVASTTTALAPVTTEPDTEGFVTPTITQPIPLFADYPNVEVPGQLAAIDAEGSIIIIDTERPRPLESTIGLVPTSDDPLIGLALRGAGMVGFEENLSIEGTRVVIDTGRGNSLDAFDLLRLAPDGEGGALLVRRENGEQIVTHLPLPLAATTEGDAAPEAEQPVRRWRLASEGPTVVGVWGEDLIVHRSSRFWLLATDPGAAPRPLGDGELLSYDGIHLSRLVCEGLNDCTIVVGTPDAPETHRLPLPSSLSSLPLTSWAGSVAVSPDGARLVTIMRNGGVWMPLLIDLETGEEELISDANVENSPVVWSPDGEWIGYFFVGDVMVRHVESQQSSRIIVNRDMQTLLWR